MVKTKEALITSLISAIIISIIYWIIQQLSSMNVWVVGIIVFVVAFIGMKWRDLTK